MKRVVLTGLKHGFQLIPFIKLLRESGVPKLSLCEAMGVLDQIRGFGQAGDLYFNTSDDATAFIRQAETLGGVTSTPVDVPDSLATAVRSNSSSDQPRHEVTERPSIDVAGLGPEDLDSLAVTWLDCHRLPINSPERAKLDWICELEYDLIEDAPEKLWLLILAVTRKINRGGYKRPCRQVRWSNY